MQDHVPRFFFKFACRLLCLERNGQSLILMAVSVQWGETEYQPNVICLSLSDVNILLSIDGLCTVTRLPVNKTQQSMEEGAEQSVPA